jgi:WD40 repeat protein
VADSSNNVAISIGYDGKILIWSISPAQSISQQRRSGIRSNSAASSTSPAATLVGHKSPILECNYHNNGGTRGVLASGDREGKVIIWEIESGAMIARYKGHNGSVTALDTIQNSNENKTYFMTGGSDGMVKVLSRLIASSNSLDTTVALG